MRTSTIQPPLGTPLNRSHPLSQGMVAYWLLNEPGGLNCYDSAKRCNIPGAATSGVVATVGQKGVSRIFATVATDAINIGTQPALNLTTSPITMSAWVYITGAAVTGSYYIASDFNSGGTLNSMGLNRSNVSGKFQFFWAAAAATIASTTVAALNTWYHVVGVRRGVTGNWTISIYVNGLLENSGSTATNPSAQQQFQIARPGALAGNFSIIGNIMNVSIHNRILSGSEIMQLYTNPYAMFQGGKQLKK